MDFSGGRSGAYWWINFNNNDCIRHGRVVAWVGT
jgi:hypothetical protein